MVLRVPESGYRSTQESAEGGLRGNAAVNYQGRTRKMLDRIFGKPQLHCRIKCTAREQYTVLVEYGKAE
jgi:hypothetical protein